MTQQSLLIYCTFALQDTKVKIFTKKNKYSNGFSMENASWHTDVIQLLFCQFRGVEAPEIKSTVARSDVYSILHGISQKLVSGPAKINLVFPHHLLPTYILTLTLS